MKENIDAIKTTIKSYILENFLKGEDPEELNDTTSLISGGTMDSISTIQLVDYLEKQYGIEFQAHEVDRDNLDNISMIAEFVKAKTG